MGFYGNITNTNKTQFTFDRTYPNRKTMEARLATDEIYLGRYVLIEYDMNNHNTLDTFLKCYVKKNEQNEEQFYTSPNFEADTQVKWSQPKNEADSYPTPSVNGTVTSNQLIYVEKDLTPDNNVSTVNTVFYQCTNVKETSTNGSIATFRAIAPSETPYTSNYNIDTAMYGAGRGYDSTVWQKVYSQNTEKYVMIAELNSVVPTFDLAVDAPTMTPITPHFDEYSTNVYYKLHWQPQWGLRVARQGSGINSDETAFWTTSTYDPATDKLTTTTISDVPAAINYNKPAFEPYQTDHKHDNSNNYFTILPTGVSGQLYNAHNGTGEYIQQADIQEMRINLPAIGNMVSDAWDIIHGPNRDDARTDANSSLQGRLNSFKAISNNQIPVKRAVDGTLVGSKINGAVHYSNESKEILATSLDIDNFNSDDAWIKTVINTDSLNAGDNNQSNNSGISIHHTHHKTKDSTSFVDKNQPSNNTTTEFYKNDYIEVENLTADTDVIKLYTPYVDQAGHIVGKNIETITLPYSYRTYTTSGLEESTDDLYTSIVENEKGAHTSTVSANSSTTIASETQDSIEVAPGNKWIQTKFDDDKLTIAHEIHAIPTNSNNPTNINTETNANNENNINIPDWNYDKAGHIIEKHDHYYTLPFGYKTIIPGNASTLLAEITSNNTSIIADKTQDTLIIAPGNKWVRIAGDNSNDTLTIAHEVHEIEKDAKDATPLDGVGTFTVQDLIFDEAGHATANQAHSYALPYAIRNISVKGSEAVTGGSTVEGTVEAKAYNHTLNLNAQNRWINLKVDNNAISIGHAAAGNETTTAGDTTASTPNFGDTFNVPYIKYDEMGHIASSNVRTVKIPQGSLTDTASTDTANVLTSIDLNETTGNIITTHQNVGTLKLTDYKLPTAVSDNGKILETESLNTAIGKIEFRVNAEQARATDAEQKLSQKIDDTIEGLKVDSIIADEYSFIKEVSEANGKIAADTAYLENVKLKTAVPLNSSDNIAINDTLSQALGKLQAQIDINETAIKTLNDGIDPDKIDSVKDLITYTEEHGETTKGILDAIGKKASTDENGNPIASTGIYSLIDAEAAARKTLVSNVQADWNATEGLAVILNKPTNLVTSDQITNMVENEDIQDMITKNDSFTYRELFDKAGSSISLETTLTIQALLNKVAELEERIYALEHPDIQAPTEGPVPEEGEEETPTE